MLARNIVKIYLGLFTNDDKKKNNPNGIIILLFVMSIHKGK